MSIRRNIKPILVAIASFFILWSQSSSAENKAENETAPKGAALVVNGKKLVTFFDSLDGLTPDQRAERASLVLRKLSKEPNFNSGSLKATDGLNGTDIVAGFNRVATITAADAQYNDGNTKLVANDFILKVRYALMDRHTQVAASDLAIGFSVCIFGFFILVLSIAVVCRLAVFTCEKLESFIASRHSAIKFQEAELLSARSLEFLSNVVF